MAHTCCPPSGCHDQQNSFPNPQHDHAQCIAEAMAKAASQCADKGAKLTPVRRRVLELIWQAQAPIGAYAILEQLAQDGFNAAPPTVYRALDFLLANDLIHKIERLNAFIGCTQPGASHSSQFLVCQSCGRAVELQEQSIDQALAEAAAKLGFRLQSQVVEATGLCPACQSSPQPKSQHGGA